ncbi:MAG: HEAT repeat domain-containing protein [Candidatus Helarchaeota archaeon]
MSKFEKKFNNILKSEDLNKILNAIRNQLKKDKKIEQKSEAFGAISLFFKTCKEKSWVFPEDLFKELLNELDHENWIIRRNSLRVLSDIAEIDHEKVIPKDILSKLREIYKKDQNWAVRNAAIEVLGKIGEKIPGRIVPFLIDQISDPDADVRLSILTSLKSIVLSNKGELKQILPIFINAYKKDEDFRVSTFAEEAIKEFAEKKKAEGTAYKKTNVKLMTCPYCKQSVNAEKDICSNCGKPLPKCQICNQRITSDSELFQCPLCNTFFHVEHFKEWYKENKNCPVCLGEIDFQL